MGPDGGELHQASDLNAVFGAHGLVLRSSRTTQDLHRSNARIYSSGLVPFREELGHLLIRGGTTTSDADRKWQVRCRCYCNPWSGHQQAHPENCRPLHEIELGCP